MKRLLAILLVLAMLLAPLAACNSDTDDEAPAEEPTEAPAETEAPEEPDEPEEEPDEAPAASGNDDMLVVGFAQIGQESGWRDAETASIQWHAAQNLDTIELKFADGQGDQSKQIEAVRTFIEMGVDVIGIAPKEETGWDAVLTEAKEAGIPVIFVDRTADVSEDLFASFIGSDFIEEGKNAAIEMAELLGGSGRVVELEGSPGASAANERKEGFHAEIEANWPDIEIIDSQTGQFERAVGKEVMESFLKTYDDIDGVYAHNDDMMLGAIEAMKEAGKKPGEEIVTVSVDGVYGIFEAMVAGEANVTVECNPLLGPQFFDACWALKNGEEIPRWIKSEEGIFRADTAAVDIETRAY